MKVVQLNTKPTLDTALEVVEALKKDLIDGKVTAFFVAALNDGDETIAYVSSVKGVSRLRMQGAMSQALYHMQTGEDI